MDIASVNLTAGWLGILAGVVSGCAIGLFFHRADWLGGYASFRRRMTRLGHISFFGLGFINLLFVFSIRGIEIAPLTAQVASASFVLGLVTMPLCCFLAAWRESFRHLFSLPIGAVSVGVIALLFGLQPL